MVRDLGARLKEARMRAGYTQKQVADALGLSSDSSISTYEKSGSDPSAQTLMKLAALYHVSTDELLGLDKRTFIQFDQRLSNEQLQLLIRIADEFKLNE